MPGGQRRRLPDSNEKTNSAFGLPSTSSLANLVPPGCVALAGEESTYRVRVGDYRIMYEVLDGQLVIHVVRVGHRRDVYRAR